MNRFNSECRDEWIDKGNYQIRGINLCVGDKSKKTATIQKDTTFSVLICTIPERETDFEELWNHLSKLRNGLPESLKKKVEIVAISDNRKMTIGDKRNLLLDNSVGDYVAFIDDDDWVSNNYLLKILWEIKKGPDAIGFNVKCENYPKPGFFSIATVGMIEHNWEEIDGEIFRPPYHKTPVKATIAKAARFPSISYAEDAEYSRRIRPMIHKVEFIPESLYIYNAPTTHDKNRYTQNGK